MNSVIKKAIDLYHNDGLPGLKNKFVEMAFHPIISRYHQYKLGNGIDVMDSDWDNLIILDACRFDSFEKCNSIDGSLQSVVSRGSTSSEFIDNNFSNRELHDTVYVTANPYVTRISPDVFHAVLTLLDNWDDDLQTVLPNTVAKRAIKAHNTYPNKKLIIHFMQPHQPYIGKKGDEIKSKMEKNVDVVGWQANKINDGNEPQRSDGVKPLRAPTVDGIDVSRNDVISAYHENLNIVLDHVEEMIKKIDGKTVITSDHGELIGEKITPISGRTYGHPGEFWMPDLRIVPWFVIEAENRRDVFAEESEVYENVEKSELDQKLRALGYRS